MNHLLPHGGPLEGKSPRKSTALPSTCAALILKHEAMIMVITPLRPCSVFAMLRSVMTHFSESGAFFGLLAMRCGTDWELVDAGTALQEEVG